MDVYADVFFAVSFLMDYFVLWVAGRLARARTKKRQIAFGALAGSLPGTAMLFVPAFGRLVGVAGTALLFAAAVVAFEPRTIKDCCRLTGTVYLCAFAAGGAAFAAYYATGGRLMSALARVNPLHLAAGAALFWGAAAVVATGNRAGLAERRTARISIFWGAGRADLTALVDTGSTLREPISGAPVVAAEFSAIAPLLPEGARRLFDEHKQDDLSAILTYTSGTRFAGRLRMIPFASVGRQNGVLLGFRPDRAEIDADGVRYSVSDLAVGILDFRLDANGAYQALVSPELIEVGNRVGRKFWSIFGAPGGHRRQDT
ncbi:MAG: sigma-E processing peptidase SpoIIGA [Clostridiales bacterium]|jgi:stage II sporulation protein GA (sporulation sigma-E factor processing peptidase)|nr:sigma-E processing peptidase SpoIIGA [Clostridiales bacterium]